MLDIRAAFEPAVIVRGQAYARDGHVRALKITSDGHAIAADLAGSNGASYRVLAYISRARSGRVVISGDCECPVGMDCKHVAATLIAALEHGAPTTRAPTDVIPAATYASTEVIPPSREHVSSGVPTSQNSYW